MHRRSRGSSNNVSKSLSEIAWLRAVSVVALMSVLISVLWYGAERTDEWNLDTILFWDSKGVSIAVPILIYGYDAVPILPSVEDSMREKHKFPRALALAYIVNIMINFFFCVYIPYFWIQHRSLYSRTISPQVLFA